MVCHLETVAGSILVLASSMATGFWLMGSHLRSSVPQIAIEWFKWNSWFRAPGPMKWLCMHLLIVIPTSVCISAGRLGALFQDNSASLPADFTYLAALGLLQTSLAAFEKLSAQEIQDSLSSFREKDVVLCISKVIWSILVANCYCFLFAYR